MEKKVLTLTFIHRDGKVLLGLKKRGYGAGRWNGFGGKLNTGETVEQGMIRELFEESGLTSKKHEKIALINFTNDIEDKITECHIYQIHEYEGEPMESEEMLPRWFSPDEIPYAEMWPDDEYWLPLAIDGKKLRAEFSLENHSKITEYKIEVVDDL